VTGEDRPRSSDPGPSLLSLEPFAEARRRIRDSIHHTPTSSATLLGRRLGVDLRLKAENLQKTGSFKVRGVLNRLLRSRRPGTEEAEPPGVVTVSAGNHAQALAWGARAAGLPCTVVMPESAPRAKVEASREYGATVILHGTVFDAFRKARALAEEEGLDFVHPFDDPDVVAGQGTVGLEILEDLPDVGAVLVPVGGGGLVAGIAAALKLSRPDVEVYGVEPEGAAVMRASLDAGEPVELDSLDTVADGLASPMAGELTYRLVERFVDDVVVVSDAAIERAMCAILRWTKLLVEPAGAAGVAALMEDGAPALEGSPVVAVLSGGNVDLMKLSEIIRRSEES
jgi:threonine dehydratase